MTFFGSLHWPATPLHAHTQKRVSVCNTLEKLAENANLGTDPIFIFFDRATFS